MAEAADKRPGGERRVGWLTPANVILLTMTAAALLGGVVWIVNRLAHVQVLDARISADMVLISSRVPGWVVSLPVGETQLVAPGALLLQIDPRYATLAEQEVRVQLAALDAELEALKARRELIDARTSTHLEVTRSRQGSVAARLAAARSELAMASADWQRAGPLLAENVMTQKEWEAERSAFLVAEQQVNRLQAEALSATAEVNEAQAERAELAVLDHTLTRVQQERERARLELDRAGKELADHALRSPIPAIIDEVFVDPGEYVAAGQRVMLLHNPTRVWIKANVKETDLRHFAVGKPVDVSVDAFPGERFTAHVQRIGSAATSQFALLPNANPSGNFTKITQRVEVSMDLDSPDARLRPGMMVELQIDK